MIDTVPKSTNESTAHYTLSLPAAHINNFSHYQRINSYHNYCKGRWARCRRVSKNRMRGTVTTMNRGNVTDSVSVTHTSTSLIVSVTLTHQRHWQCQCRPHINVTDSVSATHTSTSLWHSHINITDSVSDTHTSTSLTHINVTDSVSVAHTSITFTHTHSK